MLKPCQNWVERLSAYLDEEVDAVERQQVEDHLAHCDRCRAAAELARCDRQDAATALAERGADNAFAARVMSQISVTAIAAAETSDASHSREGAMQKRWSDLLRKKIRFGWVEGAATLMTVLIIATLYAPFFGTAREKGGIHSSFMAKRHDEVLDLPRGERNDEKAPAPLPHAIAGTATNGGQPVTDNRPASNSYTSMAAGASGSMAPSWSVKTSPSSPTFVLPEKNYGLADKLQIAYNANVAVESDNVQQATECAELLFHNRDGFLLSSQYQRGNDGALPKATVSGRIPAEQLGAMLVALDQLGTLVTRSVNGDDLTADHLAQLESLLNLQQNEDNLTRIAGKAGRTGEALHVEDARDQSAQAAAGKRVEEYKLKSRVILADVTVQITGKPVAPVAAPPVNPFSASAAGSLHALTAFGQWLLTVILIPLGIWLPAWGPLLGITLYVRRRWLNGKR